MEGVGAVSSERAVATLDSLGANGRVDEGQVGVVSLVKGAGWDTEVLGQNVLWCVRNPVGNHEGGSKKRLVACDWH